MSTTNRTYASERAQQSHLEWTGKNIADGGVCDFCLAVIDPATVSTFTANGELADMLVASDGSSITHISDPYWAACPACAPIVAYGSPEKLAAHVIATTDYERLGIPVDKTDMEHTLTGLYRRLFKVGVTRTEGPPTP